MGFNIIIIINVSPSSPKNVIVFVLYNFEILLCRSVWYDAEHFPSSWRLDPTEGPSRVRSRLQRFHLDVDKKYIMEDYQRQSKYIVVLRVNALTGS